MLVVAAEPPALSAPSLPGSVVPPKDQLGIITYLVEGQRHNMDYAFDKDTRHLHIGDQVINYFKNT